MEGVQGPNTKKLIAKRMATILIPHNGGFQDGLRALASPTTLQNAARSATKEIEETIAALKRCPEYRNSDEETIAADLLKRLEEQEQRYVRK